MDKEVKIDNCQLKEQFGCQSCEGCPLLDNEFFSYFWGDEIDETDKEEEEKDGKDKEAEER